MEYINVQAFDNIDMVLEGVETTCDRDVLDSLKAHTH